MEKEFKAEKFVKYVSETKRFVRCEEIADNINCTVRRIQKWAKINNVPHTLVRNKKCYQFYEDDLLKFKKWHERKLNKPPKEKKNKYSVTPIEKKAFEGNQPTRITIPREDNFPSIKIRDIVRNYWILEWDEKETAIIKRIQKYCKSKGIQKVRYQGRFYYKITEELKVEIVKMCK